MDRPLASSQQSTPGVASKFVSSAPASPESAHLLRQLTAGQMCMVAVGGSIGTGLLLGSGAAIQIAGPGVIISYVIGACIAFVVTMALGEMACRHPGAGSFGIYADLYLGEWAGFIVRNAYWFSIMISVSGELVAAATYTRFWFPNIPALVWIAVYAALLLFINLRQVGDFGAFEYWFAMIKVVIIFIFVLLGTALLVGHKVQAQYTSDGGFLPHGAAAPFLPLSFPLFILVRPGVVAVAFETSESWWRWWWNTSRRRTLSSTSLARRCLAGCWRGGSPWHRTSPCGAELRQRTWQPCPCTLLAEPSLRRWPWRELLRPLS